MKIRKLLPSAVAIAVATALTTSASAAPLALDENFRAPLFTAPAPAWRTLLLPDGKFLLFFNTDTLADQRTGAITRHLTDGSIDSSFGSNREYKFVGAAAAGAEGKVYVSAKSYLYGAEQTENVLRLNSDGSIDRSFTPVPVATEPFSNVASIRQIVLQPDGRILVAGYFNTIAGTSQQKISRLLPNGTLDPTFTPPQFVAGEGIWAPPHLLPDGKILIGGQFGEVDGQPAPSLARLNPDGSLDSTFQAAGFTLVNVIRGIVRQSDGKIVIGGRFRFGSSFPQYTYTPLVRLNADGSADNSFARETSFVTAFDLVTRALIALPDGKMLGAIGRTIYRFNADGSRDLSFSSPVARSTTFVPYGASESVSILTVHLQSDGRILFGGNFTDVDGPAGNPLDGSHFGVARLQADGTLDPSLATSHKTSSEITPGSFSRLADGSTLVGFPLLYQRVAPAMAFNVGRLGVDGALDSSFSLAPADDAGFLSPVFTAEGFEKMADDKFFVVGSAENFEFTYGKVMASGARDPLFAFDPAAPFFKTARPLSDGGVLIAADTDVQATVDGSLARLKITGTLDPSFALAPAIRNAQITREAGTFTILKMAIGLRVLGVRADGRILIEYLGFDELIHLVRLNSDGSIDGAFSETTLSPKNLQITFPQIYDRYTGQTFQPPDGVLVADLPLLDALIQADGSIVLVGKFTSFNGAPARGIVRLHADGTFDDTFLSGGGAQWTQTTETDSFFPIVEAVEMQNDGKLLFAGTFEAFNGSPAPGIVSLNADGSVDGAFVPPAVRRKSANLTTVLARQPDGSFNLAGAYSFPTETEPAFIHISSFGGVPIIGSGTVATAIPNQQFTYQIIASGQPTSFAATGLPAAFSFDPTTGKIIGTPTAADIGSYTINLTATNSEGTSLPQQLILRVPAPVSIASVASRKYHGTAGYFDVPLPQTGNPGVESRSGAKPGFHTIVLTFANSILSAGRPTVTSGTGTVTNVGIGSNQSQYFIDVSGVADAQTLKLTMNDVIDSDENYSLRVDVQVAVLAGDVGGNGSVSASDIAQTKAVAGQAIMGSNFRADLNANGSINSSDVGAVKANAGAVLPAFAGVVKATR